jgi:hypothetical protein
LGASKAAPIIGTLVVFDEKFSSILGDVQRENGSGSRRNLDRLSPEVDICVMPTEALEVLGLAKPRYSREPSVPTRAFG